MKKFLFLVGAFSCFTSTAFSQLNFSCRNMDGSYGELIIRMGVDLKSTECTLNFPLQIGSGYLNCQDSGQGTVICKGSIPLESNRHEKVAMVIPQSTLSRGQGIVKFADSYYSCGPTLEVILE